ncbi:MAG: TRAP transporter small permease [Rhodospirillaceae bacterium]|jgi:TRAP-type transport system small permease protein|nr:TRAP transporter small permease [Rhodospirillaceae bacterium]MBT4589626.1 TRAP transporter small permease [Rhodospirillaceae bacterium]MBT7269195.1 TRAP transporter small permease [Rhodospirillaceae bacterium]
MGETELSSQSPMAGGTSVWDQVDRVIGLLLAITIFFMMSVTLIDVIGRYFFHAPLPAADELTKLAMAVSIFGGLPLVTRHREHVTISLFDGLFPTSVLKIRQVVVDLICIGVMGGLCWRLILQAQSLADFNDKTLFLGVPLAPFAYFMAIMSGITIVVLFLMLWRDLTGSKPSQNSSSNMSGLS